ncbi:MAG: O-antigen ligase family protein [Oscillospiraceae bacterium]|nr:O-antigen ligase family protein [Oscillospiraceae bacterium]
MPERMTHTPSVENRKREMRQGLRSLWLTLLFAAQPVLDALAFWTRDEVATPAGYIRLVILLLLPAAVLITTREKKRFLLFLAGSGLFCLLHVLNSIRTGPISLYFDLHYMANVMQMPVFTMCFLLTIRDEERHEAALRGVAIAAGLTLLFLIVARISGTGNVTYGEGLGYSGWVIDDNRNANSTNLVVYALFGVYLALRSHRRWLWVAVPAVIDAVFLSNGTKGCYFSIFVIFLCWAGWLLFEHRVQKRPLQKAAVAALLVISLFSGAIYHYTPRYKVTQSQANTAIGHQGEIEATLMEKGIDITDMSPEERFADPVIKEVFEHYYWIYLGVKPDIIDRFGMDRVLMQYRMSTKVSSLIDARVMERNYADMIFQDSDALTKLVGFEASELGFDGIYDLENDWHAIFYLYGMLGFALYMGFILYFVWRTLRRLHFDLQSGLNKNNFSLGLSFVLICGLAHFSGATLRRPNVSIWLSLVLALIYLATILPADTAPAEGSLRR